MRSGPKGSTRLLLGGMAAAGVVGAHLLAYMLAVPDAHERVHVLEATGHQNWSYIAAAAVGLLVAGLLGSIIGSLSSRRGPDRPRFFAVATRLATMQIVGFLAVESLERASVDGHLSGLISEPAIILGTLLQVVVAVAGALLLKLLVRVITTVLALRGERSGGHAAPPSFGITRSAARRLAVGTGGGTLRGPPLLLV